MPPAIDTSQHIPPVHFTHAGLQRHTREDFTLYNPTTKITRYYHAITILSYILHDVRRRKGDLSRVSPGGLDEFIEAFNDPSWGCPIRFSVATDTLESLANTTPPTVVNFEVHVRTIFPPAVTVEDGGSVLDRHRTNITQNLLWDNAERQSRFKEFQQKKKADRLQKKAQAKAFKKFGPTAESTDLGLNFNMFTSVPSTPITPIPTNTTTGNATEFDLNAFTLDPDLDATMTVGASA